MFTTITQSFLRLFLIEPKAHQFGQSSWPTSFRDFCGSHFQGYRRTAPCLASIWELGPKLSSSCLYSGRFTDRTFNLGNFCVAFVSLMDVVAHAFNPSVRETRSWVCVAGSKTARGYTVERTCLPQRKKVKVVCLNIWVHQQFMISHVTCCFSFFKNKPNFFLIRPLQHFIKSMFK